MGKPWPALVVQATTLSGDDDLLAALVDDFSPAAIEDLAERPLPPGGLWDPTFPPIPDPPPTPLHWRVFFNDGADRDGAARAIAGAHPDLHVARVDIPDEDWAARSQRSLVAVRAGRFIVAPPWDVPPSPADGVTVVIIEPSMGFGTGHHATTRLCLRALSTIDVSGRDVLDLGTGSGVLAMAAAFDGARRVVGLDVDVDAIASADTSAALNALPATVQFRVADFRSSPVDAADVVLANLTGGMLTSAAPALAALVRPGGTLIVSGFDGSEVDAVVRAFGAFGEDERLNEETWIALRLTRR